MSKNIRTFSEKITTGVRSGRSTSARSARTLHPRSSFYRNYQEVEIEMGSKDWQTLLQDIQKWKKGNGTLKAKLKGKKDAIKMKARIEKMPKTKFGPGWPGYTASQRAKFKKQGFTIREIDQVERLGKSAPNPGNTRYTDPKGWVEGGDAWYAVKGWGFVDIGRGGFMDNAFPRYAEHGISKSLIRFHQGGMNYHPAVGYY